MRNELARCLDQASRNARIRVIIITGDTEGRAFCAGADLGPAGLSNPSSMEGDAPAGRDPNLGYWRDGGGIAGLAIMRSTKPVICAINGAAVGVGMTLPLCCDMTVANAPIALLFTVLSSATENTSVLSSTTENITNPEVRPRPPVTYPQHAVAKALLGGACTFFALLSRANW